MKDIELYESVLRGMGLLVEGNSVLADLGEGETSPVKVSKKELKIPNIDYLKDNERENYHPFHPLCESVVEGQSPTVKFLQRAFRNAVTLYADHLIEVILRTMSSEKKPKSTHYHKLVDRITADVKNPKVDKSTLSAWNNIRTKMAETSVVRVSISRDELIDDDRYLRVLNYTHAYEQETFDNTAQIFGVKLARKSDKVIILNLINEVYGSIPPEVGSNDNRPYFAVILRAYAQFVKFYNHTVRALKDVVVIPVLEDIWIPEIDNLEKYENKTKSLVGNIGNEGARKAPPKQPEQPAYAPEPPPVHNPARTTAPKSTGGMSILELAAARRGGVAGVTADRPPMTPAQERAMLARQQQQSNAPQQQSNPFASAPQQSNPFANTQQQSNPFAKQQQQSNPFANTQQASNPFANTGRPSMFEERKPEPQSHGSFFSSARKY